MDSGYPNQKTVMFEAANKFIGHTANYSFLHACVIIIVLTVSLYNLTFRDGDNSLFRDLLLFTVGLVIPSPSNDKSKQQDN